MKNSEILLNNREVRVALQKSLQDQYKKTLIVIKANYPSNYKISNFTNYLTTKVFYQIKNEGKIIYYEASLTNEGLIYYLISEEESEIVKKKMIELENTILTRLVDIDVYSNNKAISRNDLGIAPRKCYLCNLDARICTRNQNHNLDEIKEYFNNIVMDDIFNFDMYYNLCIYGLINELAKPYSFGTVGFSNSGSHKDMNYKTFIDSIEVIAERFKNFEKLDRSSFEKLRSFGQEVESEMFKATNNINTHKGGIFSLILVLAGISISDKYEKINTNIRLLTKDIYDDFKDINNNPTYGMKFYQLYNISGIRKQAYEGYQSVFEIFEPYYSNTKDITKTYLKIISLIDDTTIIKRSSIDELENIKNISSKINHTHDEYIKFNEELINKNISCGGSADLLSIVLILNLVKNYYYKKKEVKNNLFM